MKRDAIKGYNISDILSTQAPKSALDGVGNKLNSIARDDIIHQEFKDYISNNSSS